jgi:NAD(P)-dependent dehydrogenase (short-subunit alcohol dehydrogenase family)
MDISDDMYLVWLKENNVTPEEGAAQIPIGRLGRPEEMVAAVLYLPSDEARFCTGSALTLDGGLTDKE